MRVKVPHDGRWLRVHDLEAGQFVLHSEEGWRSNRRLAEWRMLRNMGLMLLALFLIPFLSLILLNAAISLALAAFLLFEFALIFSQTYVLERYLDKRDRRAGVTSGLTTLGLVIRPLGGFSRFFIPYNEMDRMKSGREPLKLAHYLYIRNRRTPLRLLYLDVLLGEEGMAFLMRALGGSVQPVVPQAGPPQLRVYGPAGVQTVRPLAEGDLENPGPYGDEGQGLR